MADLYKILWFDVSMDDFLVLKEGEEFGEVVGEVDDFFDGEIVFFVLDEVEEGAFSHFCDDSDLDLVSEVFVVRLIEVKFKNLNLQRSYFKD